MSKRKSHRCLIWITSERTLKKQSQSNRKRLKTDPLIQLMTSETSPWIPGQTLWMPLQYSKPVLVSSEWCRKCLSKSVFNALVHTSFFFSWRVTSFSSNDVKNNKPLSSKHLANKPLDMQLPSITKLAKLSLILKCTSLKTKPLLPTDNRKKKQSSSTWVKCYLQTCHNCVVILDFETKV